MNKIINFDEIRKISKKISNVKSILKTIRIKDQTMIWTDSYYLIEIKNVDSPDIVINVEDYTINKGTYPDIERIINHEFEYQKPESSIYYNHIIYKYHETDDFIFYIDNEIIDQLKRFVKPKFKNLIDLNCIMITKNKGLCKLSLNDDITIYFAVKKGHKEVKKV